MRTYQHHPVLLDEVIELLDPKAGEQFIDGTVGQGGHALAILERVLPAGRLLAIDRDQVNLATARERLSRFSDNVVFANDTFANIAAIAYAHGFRQVSGILFDLGF